MNDYLVTVCAACETASCWHGEFMCCENKMSDTRDMLASHLLALGREHPDNFSREKLLKVCGSVTDVPKVREPSESTPERTANTEAELVQWFGAHMLAKLRENTHKGHWSTVHPLVLLDGLRVEVAELVNACCAEGPEAIVRECADVANFAAMLADVAMAGKGAKAGAYPGGTAGMHADLLRAENERDRWADRIKQLEERLRIVSAVANGRLTE